MTIEFTGIAAATAPRSEPEITATQTDPVQAGPAVLVSAR
jgi:hypothetical protein